MEDKDVGPPPGPPPLLPEDELISLARQGWVSLPRSQSLDRMVSSLFKTASEFFDLPAEDKARLYPSKQGTEFGYYRVSDEKEYATLRCHVHGESALERDAAQVWEASALLLHRALYDVARARHLPISVWDDILDGTLTLPKNEQEMTYTLLRLFRYFPASGFAAEHTDLGLLTICFGKGQGLQVMDFSLPSPTWVDVDGPVILAGQTLRALSRGVIRAGLHRVVGNPQGRSSIVFALRHSSRHEIDLKAFGGQGTVHPRLLWNRIRVGKVNINAVKEIREEQRAKLDSCNQGSEVPGHG